MFRLHSHLCTTCVWWPQKPSRSPRAVFTNGCELPYRCWELKLGPLKEQSNLLTAKASLQTLIAHFCCYYRYIHIYTYCMHYMHFIMIYMVFLIMYTLFNDHISTTLNIYYFGLKAFKILSITNFAECNKLSAMIVYCTVKIYFYDIQSQWQTTAVELDLRPNQQERSHDWYQTTPWD